MNDSASKIKGLFWIVAACALGAGFAFGLSPLAHAIPWSWEKSLASILPSENNECKGSSQSQALLQKMVVRLYPISHDDYNFPVDVQIIKDSSVNAYATLGGKIFVNSGLLKQAESPEEVAGVLAHEIEHVHYRHIMEGFITHIFTVEGINIVFGGSSQTADWTQYFLNMDFTRTQESQADEGGLRRLQKSHIDNSGFRHFFERMGKSESALSFISDHPSNSRRLEMVGKFDNQDVKPIMTQDEWKILKNYCGDNYPNKS